MRKGISDVIFVIIKWKTTKNNTKRRKELKLSVYVLFSILVTRDTAHFERSLLNTFTLANAANHSTTIIQTGEKRQKQIPKEEENWK